MFNFFNKSFLGVITRIPVIFSLLLLSLFTPSLINNNNSDNFNKIASIADYTISESVYFLNISNKKQLRVDLNNYSDTKLRLLSKFIYPAFETGTNKKSWYLINNKDHVLYSYIHYNSTSHLRSPPRTALI